MQSNFGCQRSLLSEHTKDIICTKINVFEYRMGKDLDVEKEAISRQIIKLDKEQIDERKKERGS